MEAVHLAQLDDVVNGLPDGIETAVGERGVRLSGGQRQRVGLARALYVRPTVLVLDEATSNLDTTTEQRIVETLANLHGGLTTIVVAHRLSTVQDCDYIVYLENASVRAIGTFEEVKASVPEFGEPAIPDPVVEEAETHERFGIGVGWDAHPPVARSLGPTLDPSVRGLLVRVFRAAGALDRAADRPVRQRRRAPQLQNPETGRCLRHLR